MVKSRGVWMMQEYTFYRCYCVLCFLLLMFVLSCVYMHT